jgi:hypothetical protein
MGKARVGWVAWTVVGLAACGNRPLDVATDQPGAVGSSDPAKQALTAATGCAVTAPGRGWVTVPVARQTGAFTWDFNARVLGGRTDAVTGLVSGTASGYTSLAAIVRFNNAGAIDVRRGNAYSADAFVPYSPAVDYHVRMAVDLTSHLYTVWVTPPGQAPVRVAASYPFRTEQAGVTALDGYAAFVDPDGFDNLEVCGSVIGPARSLSASEPQCAFSAVGAAWVNRPLDRQTGQFFYEFEATPWNYGIDAVVGVSSGAATGYDNLAAITRFAPTGLMDARNGGGYKNDSTIQYTPGIAMRVSMAVDVGTHRYSMWAAEGTNRPWRIAGNYAFRTSQSAVTALDNAGQFADPESRGSFTVCSPQAERSGQPLWAGVVQSAQHLAISQDGKTLIGSSTGASMVVDAATGQVLRRVSLGGLIAVAGPFYYVLDVFPETGIGDDRTPYVAKLDSNWIVQWARPFTGTGAVAMAATELRGVAVASAEGITFYDKDGQLQWTRGPSASAVAFDEYDLIRVTGNLATGIYVSALNPFGGVVWRHDYTSDHSITAGAITADVDGGTVFGGGFFGTVDFGGGPVSFLNQDAGRAGYLVGLDVNGQHRYSRSVVEVRAVTALAGDRIGSVAVVGLPLNAPVIEHGKVDASGRTLWWHDGGANTAIGDGLGMVRGLTSDAFGRSHLLVEPGNQQGDWPHMAAYAP